MNPRSALATQAIRGLFWTGIPVVLPIFTILLFYALLDAKVMGRFEAALNWVMLLALLADLGISAALVQFRQMEEVHYSSAFWANLLIGLGVTLVVVAAVPWIVRLGFVSGNQAPENLEPIFGSLALLIPFAALSGIFRARLQRDLRFRAIALAEIIAILVSTAAVIPLLLQQHPLTPVANAVLREGVLLAGLWRASAWQPRLEFSWAALAQLLPFSFNFTGARCLNYLSTYLPAFFVYPLLGETPMAYYRFAERLTLMPLTRVSTTITRVSFPAFATIQEDDDLLRRGYLKAVQSIALLLWPVLVLLGVFAGEILQVMDKEPSLRVLQWLCLATALKAAGMVVGSIYLAKGKANWTLYWSLFTLVVLVPALYWSVPWGIKGAAGVVAGTSLLFLLCSQYLGNRLIQLDFAAFLRVLGRPGLVNLAVLVVLVAARAILPDHRPLLSLGLGGALGLAAYALALRLFAWDLCRQYWGSFRGSQHQEI